MESATLKRVSNKKNKVISTGGGIVCTESNIKFLKKGLCIWLDPNPMIIYQRLKKTHFKNRPLLAKAKNPLDTFMKLCMNRKNLYDHASIIKVRIEKACRESSTVDIVIQKVNDYLDQNEILLKE